MDAPAIGRASAGGAILGRQDGHSSGPNRHDNARTSEASREAGSESPCRAGAILSLSREFWAYIQ